MGSWGVGSASSIRLARLEDIPEIQALIRQSVIELQARDYTLAQREGALGSVFGVDRRLIEDGTYFVVPGQAVELAACGGWSRRRTLFGSDSIEGKDDSWLDPASDAARIRAFFVHPAWARRGLGRLILGECEVAARAAGFHRLELGATLTGVPLYSRCGFREIETVEVALGNGERLPIVRMGKELGRG
jgi:N-acetylglutamate synthase-like GNAT family acetyltransferase